MKARHVISAVVLIILLAGTYWLYTAVQLAVVPTGSMLPTLKPGDYLAVRTDAYESDPPLRGDIVVFSRPDESDYFVKRVIAVESETIYHFSGRVWIGRQNLNEPYVQQQRKLERPGMAVVGEDEYFVMGDNRGHSEDSRDYGPIPIEQIIGRADSIVYPFSRRTNFRNPFKGVDALSSSEQMPTAPVSSEASPQPRSDR